MRTPHCEFCDDPLEEGRLCAWCADYESAGSELPDPKRRWWTTTDVAEYLRITPGTVSNYLYRRKMPLPSWTVGRTPCWTPRRIINWHKARPRAGVQKGEQ